ncbi:MAG: hypothetical protein HRU01_12820 [Myxococcales bacterium]|nr:hypothetical protein [Myxococcales bacterium]
MSDSVPVERASRRAFLGAGWPRRGAAFLVTGGCLLVLAASGLAVTTAESLESGAPDTEAVPSDLVAPAAAIEAAVPGIALEDPATATELARRTRPAPQHAFAVGPNDPIERAWFSPAATLDERVTRTRRASLELGVWNLDAAARAVISGAVAGVPIERARAALRLAPDLPLAHMALARAQWLHGESPISALRTAGAAILSIPRHPEAAIWFAGNALYLLAMALMAAGLLVIGVAAILAAPHAAHDLGDLLSHRMPRFARAAFLSSLILIPLAFGEGVLGLAAACLALGCVYGSLGGRLALALAAAGLVGGAYPVAQFAGQVLTGLSNDRVASAVISTGQGFAHPVDGVRLEAAAETDALARMALAQRAQRNGELGSADAHYQSLLPIRRHDPTLVNNAANVRLALGHMESALDLYRESTEIFESPVALYNLSQAHGRAFQVEDLSRTLARAQSLDGVVVAELTQLQGTEAEGFVVALPVGSRELWNRVVGAGDGRRIAAELRSWLAPGRLGDELFVAAGTFAAVVLLGALLGGWIEASKSCIRCGERMCPRCDDEVEAAEICSGCIVLFQQNEKTDRAMRIERINDLRRREQRVDKMVFTVALLVPGAAGFLVDRPLRGFVGALAFATALVFVVHRDGVVHDPLVAGAAAQLFFLGIAGLAALTYATAVALSIGARRNA